MKNNISRGLVLVVAGIAAVGVLIGAVYLRTIPANLVRYLIWLSLEKTDVVGWSDGGNTALLLGRYWPQRVRRMVVISANFNPAGLTPEAQKETFEPSRGIVRWLKRWWTGAGNRLRELEIRVKRMWQTRPNLRRADLADITAPTLVIVGEADDVSTSHARLMAEWLANGSLAIIPGGHFTPVTHARRINGLIAEFLQKFPSGGPSGSGKSAVSADSIKMERKNEKSKDSFWID